MNSSAHGSRQACSGGMFSDGNQCLGMGSLVIQGDFNGWWSSGFYYGHRFRIPAYRHSSLHLTKI